MDLSLNPGKKSVVVSILILLILSQLPVTSAHAQQSTAGIVIACENQPPPDDCDTEASVNAGGIIHLFRGTFSEEYPVYTLPSATLQN